jgi:hypothetical protein
MPPQEIVMPLVMGCGLIALGLNPGALSGLKEGIERFHDTLASFSTHRPIRKYPVRLDQPVPGQSWLVAGGCLLIGLTLVAYVTH